MSASENRQKQKRITFRLHEDEYAALESEADKAGLTLASYVRERMLAAPKMRQSRRPSVEVEALARLQGAMNRVGGNIQQLTRRVNFGATPEAAEIHQAFEGYRDVIAAILAALGRK